MTVGIRAKFTEQVNLGSSQRRSEEARVEWCPWYRNKRVVVRVLNRCGCIRHPINMVLRMDEISLLRMLKKQHYMQTWTKVGEGDDT